jgi:hypothetical protein
LGSKQQKDALRIHLVEPLVRNYLFDVVSLRVIWRINDNEQVEQAWRDIVWLRKQCDEVVSRIDGISFFISSITGAFSKPHRGKYQDVTVYPAISYWIVSEKSLEATREFNMVSISNGILFGLGNKNVIVKPINIPMAGKLGAHSQCLNAVDLLAPPLFVVMKDHTNYFTIKKVEHSAEMCGDEHHAVARFVVVDTYRFRGFLQMAVDQMVHLLPGLRLVCLERDMNQPQQLMQAAGTMGDPLDMT